MLPIFRAGHPSLLIPWSEIEVQLRQRASGKGIRFVFTRVPGVYLEVSEKLGQQLLQAAGLASRSLPRRAMGEFERRNEGGQVLNGKTSFDAPPFNINDTPSSAFGAFSPTGEGK